MYVQGIHIFQRQSGKMKYIGHFELRTWSRGWGLKEKGGSLPMGDEKLKCKQIFAGPSRNNGTKRRL